MAGGPAAITGGVGLGCSDALQDLSKPALISDDLFAAVWLRTDARLSSDPEYRLLPLVVGGRPLRLRDLVIGTTRGIVEAVR